MSKKSIFLIIIIIVVSLILSIYIPNKEKIEEKNVESSTYEIIEENEKIGVKNDQGKIIIEAKYDNIIIPNKNREVFFCYSGKNVEILNSKSEKIFTEYSKVSVIENENENDFTLYEQNVLLFEKDGKYGLINYGGKIVVDAKYNEISVINYKFGEFLVNQNGKYGIIKEDGTILLKTMYDKIEMDNYYAEECGYKKAGYIVCKKTTEGYKYGYYDYEGTKVLETEYNEISRITQIISNNIYLLVAQNGQYGVFVNGSKIINTQYQSILYESNLKMFIVERTGKYGVLNENGVEILKVENDSVQIKGIFIYVQNGETKKVYDKSGKEVDIPFNVIIQETSNVEYYIKIEQLGDMNYYTIADKYYKDLISEKYTYIEYAYKNFFIVYNENRQCGVIDNKGNIIIELKYNSIQKEPEKEALRAFINDEQVDFYDETCTKVENEE